MAVLLLALSSAFFIGLSNVFIKKGLDSATRTQVIFVSLLTSTLLLWILNIALGNLAFLFVPAVSFFLLAGLLGPGLGRTFKIVSLKRVGVSRTVPITGTAPFFATVLAILFLGEEYSLFIFLGMALIIFGIFLLSRRKENGVRVFDKKDLLIPLASAFFGGFSITISKYGLDSLDNPILGSLIAITAALSVVLIYSVATKRLQTLQFSRTDFKFPALAGAAMASAMVLNMQALHDGNVSMVAPVFSTFPLFGVFLSSLFLGEQITGRTWLGAVIIVVGIVIIQAF